MGIIKLLKRILLWLKKSIQYSYFLWLSEDNDNDWSCILKLLQYKLKRTREHITSHNIIADVNMVKKQIKFTELVIGRVLGDDYCSKIYDEHDKKWGEPKLVSTKDKKSSFNYIAVKRENVFTSFDEGCEHKEFMKIIDEHERQFSKDFNRLFNHMKKYMRNWWD